MDKLYIENLEIFAKHGVFGEEKTLGQKFVISLELFFDAREAAITGDLTKSVHYGELCHKLEKEFQRESYDLIETAAEKTAEFILKEYDILKAVKVMIKKPWAPIGKHLEYAAIEIYRQWHKVFIALGSNMGDKNSNLTAAIDKLKESKHTKVIKVSNFITTEPWGYESQDKFLNGVAEISTILSPIELINYLLEVEKELKRERIIKWGPRTIDLDVLLYDDIISSEEAIVIPHPRMHERLFVIEPLAEIAPYEFHPVLRKRIFEIKEELLSKRN
ncbi:2-amino-4-hydroxy-6-hydroxymethyldihydropteridine diphosphokinase [Clostridium manihotivorum]|uniref:Bifunctional folate synthesis protein n=1 Tax=Clostridium manihotivorum TaxID=2320868 RepID=A0A410DYF7_9CLOT|nr:2-amino-4-hydroxy-6-hydroxymethyldihydropteridine diphosphokinase [Clostridium manihotivorum]QAA34032.1 2-amino-4-hydroxy-6-hydroxymethyldihydropteridine pyrophosphokinase [Clostridium manihotivorum]